MLSLVDFKEDDKFLYLDCGYGVVGILNAKLMGSDKVVMIDNDKLVVKLFRENALLNNITGIIIHESDGFIELDEKSFTIIMSNPSYHKDLLLRVVLRLSLLKFLIAKS